MAIGDTFILHGRSGVLTLAIERESESHDGLMMIVGTVIGGVEHYCEEDGTYFGSRDVAGKLIAVFTTKEDLARGTNEPLGKPPTGRIGTRGE